MRDKNSLYVTRICYIAKTTLERDGIAGTWVVCLQDTLRIVLELANRSQPNYDQPQMNHVGLTESYNLVQLDPSELSISRSTCSPTRECVRVGWKRSLNCAAVSSPSAAKHGKFESFCMSSTKAVATR